jgi:hypothetical protein
MLTLEELIQKPDMFSKIDWDLNPQEAFEMYQVKSKDSWKHRHLPEVLHFYVDVWKGKAEVFLMRRSLKSAEDIALIPVPNDLIDACLKKQVGEPVPSGQYAIDDPIRDWIRSELGM